MRESLSRHVRLSSSWVRSEGELMGAVTTISVTGPAGTSVTGPAGLPSEITGSPTLEISVLTGAGLLFAILVCAGRARKAVALHRCQPVVSTAACVVSK